MLRLLFAITVLALAAKQAVADVVTIDVDADLACDRAMIRHTIADRLSKQLGPSHPDQPTFAITIASPTEMSIEYRDGHGGKTTRRLKRSSECDLVAQWIAYEAYNLASTEA